MRAVRVAAGSSILPPTPCVDLLPACCASGSRGGMRESAKAAAHLARSHLARSREISQESERCMTSAITPTTQDHQLYMIHICCAFRSTAYALRRLQYLLFAAQESRDTRACAVVSACACVRGGVCPLEFCATMDEHKINIINLTRKNQMSTERS